MEVYTIGLMHRPEALSAQTPALGMATLALRKAAVVASGATMSAPWLGSWVKPVPAGSGRVSSEKESAARRESSWAVQQVAPAGWDSRQ